MPYPWGFRNLKEEKASWLSENPLLQDFLTYVLDRL